MYCDDDFWEDLKEHLQALGVLPRFTPEWKEKYALPPSIERIFRSLKHSRGLEGHCARGRKKVMLQATLSVLTHLMTVLARLKAGDVKRMRHMAVPLM